MIHIYKLLTSMFGTDRHVNPDIYLAANAEILFLTILMSLGITYTFNHEVLGNNGIRDMVGYNNPCVFWDSPPALYFAAFFFTPTVYFAIRYAVLDTQRAFLTKNLSDRMKRAVLVANFWYAVSQALNMLIFVVTPEPGDVTKLRMHSAFFLQLVPSLGLCMALNYFEGWAAGEKVQKHQVVILAVSSTVTLLETVMAFVAVFAYQNDKKPVINPWAMFLVDWAWFLCLPLISSFDPPSPAVHIEVSLDPKKDSVDTEARGEEESAPMARD
mmetsp:Transcript_27912/g.63133  ORF Transcript_27912/g.63133 Transcript_27912/m.63133 type:complete len:271 (+) Transcript_27912:124-936(+)